MGRDGGGGLVRAGRGDKVGLVGRNFLLFVVCFLRWFPRNNLKRTG